MVDLANGIGAKIIFTYLPVNEKTTTSTYYHYHLGGKLADKGAIFLDLTQTFRETAIKYGTRRIHVIPGIDSHPSKFAHAIYAQELIKLIAPFIKGLVFFC